MTYLKYIIQFVICIKFVNGSNAEYHRKILSILPSYLDNYLTILIEEDDILDTIILIFCLDTP